VETPPLDQQGSPPTDSGPTRARVPRWPWLIGTSLSLLGLGVATYLTYEHYTGSKTLSCPARGGLINCLNVTTSVYSKIHGVPVAVLGLVFFVVMLALQIPPAWSSSSRALRWGRVGWSLVGVGTAVWLVYAELVKIHNICLWCTSVHIISFLIFLSTAFGTIATMPDVPDEEEDVYEDVDEEYAD
jgi:uncharacterized membrane protein